MSEERQAEHKQDPGPVKHSDAERVTEEETKRVPTDEDQDPDRERTEQSP